MSQAGTDVGGTLGAMRRWLAVALFLALVLGLVVRWEAPAPVSDARVAPASQPADATEPTVGALLRTVLEQTRCVGPVDVVDASGAGMVGARIEVRGEFLVTGPKGRAEWPGRACGEHRLDVRAADVQYPAFRVTVTDHTPVVVELPSDNEATVAFVDEAGAPLEAAVDRTAYLRSASRVSEGWRIVAPGERVRLRVAVEGRPPAGFDLPLDGGHHTFVVPLARRVRVTAACPPKGCPEVECMYTPCTPEGPDRWLCECPLEGAQLTNVPVLYTIPDGARAIHVDLTDTRTQLRAQWTGSLPCEAYVRWGRGRSSDLCGGDGSISGNIGVGAFLLEVTGAGGDRGRVVFEASGGELDLGPVAEGGDGEVPKREAEVMRTEGDTGGDSGEEPAEEDDVDDSGWDSGGD